MGGSMDYDLMKDIFMDLRRIMRAMDVYSRQLAGSHGLTGPQMLCLREITTRGSLTTGALARAVRSPRAREPRTAPGRQAPGTGLPDGPRQTDVPGTPLTHAGTFRLAPDGPLDRRADRYPHGARQRGEDDGDGWCGRAASALQKEEA